MGLLQDVMCGRDFDSGHDILNIFLGVFFGFFLAVQANLKSPNETQHSPSYYSVTLSFICSNLM